MEAFKLLKNREGVMTDDTFAQAVIEEIQVGLLEDPAQAKEFSDWWLGVELFNQIVDINAYSGVYADKEGLHITVYATVENGDGTISTDVSNNLGRAEVTSEEDTTILFGDGVTKCVWN